MNSPKVERKHLEHEIKFRLGTPRVASVLAGLNSLCRPDPDHPSNVVVSIYYDTRRLSSLGEKLNSDLCKTKVRIRWYEDPESGKCLPLSFLELKYRLGTGRKKTRIKTPYAADWIASLPLDHPTLLTIPPLLRSAGLNPPAGLYPFLTIRYHRRRFQDPFSDSRFSLDTRISVQRVNTRLMIHRNPTFLDINVLEVKNREGELPRNLRFLLGLGPRLSSFSKYGACFQAARSTHFIRH